MNNTHWLARCLIVSATSIALAAPLAANAASDIFLKIDGIKGESTADGHKDEIEVSSWSWGMSRAATLDGTARTRSSACLSDIAFTKNFDAASPALMANVVSGMTIPGATLTLRKAGEGKQQDYLIITLKDVLVTSVSDSGSSGEIPMESISLKFSSAKVSYKTQKPDGTLGTAIETTLSVKGGASC